MSDLEALLRIACRQGQLRLNCWFSAQNGWQANLANSGKGWTVDHDRDPLVAIEKVLRQRYGRVLERAGAAVSDDRQLDIEEAIASASAEDLIG